MRFQTFLFLLLTLFAIGIIDAGGSRDSSSHGSSSHGGHTEHQESRNSNTNFLKSERGGAKRQGSQNGKSGDATKRKTTTTPRPPSAPTERHPYQDKTTIKPSRNNSNLGTNQQSTPDETHPLRNNSRLDNNQTNAEGQTNPPWNNTHLDTKQPNTTDQVHPLRNNSRLDTNQTNAEGQTNPPRNNSHLDTNKTNAQNQTYPSWSHFSKGNDTMSQNTSTTSIGFENYMYHENSIPMGNPYSVYSSGNIYNASGPTYYPQQPQMIAQPAVQPFVPGQTVLVIQEDSSPDRGQMVKEAVVYLTINAEVNSTDTRHVVHHHHHHHHHHHATQSNKTAMNQTNSTAGPRNLDNSFYKISDTDIFNITEDLFARSLDISKYINLDLQIRSTSINATDEAKKPLFKIDPILLNYPTIYVTHTLYDKYGHDFRDKVNYTQEIREHENLLIDTYLDTNVMATAMKWLGDRGFIDLDDFERKDVLRRIWFTIFSGSTCGFERVFESENYGTAIIGVQDWLYFADRESSGRINYMSYVDKLKLGNTASLLKLNFEMDGIVRPNATIFVGTTPELEMSLYTICLYTRLNDACPISLGGAKFNIYTHSFTYFGNLVMDLGLPIL